MFCSNCGKQAPDGAKFCTGCGSPIAAPVAPAAPAPVAPVVEPVVVEPAPVVEPVAEPVVVPVVVEPVVEPAPVVVPVAPAVEPVSAPVVEPVAPVIPVAEPVAPVAPAPVVEPTPAPVTATEPVAPVVAPAPVAPKAKTPAWAIALIIILAIAVLGAAGYIVYDKVFADDSYSDSDDDDKDNKNKNSGGASSGDSSSDDGASENNPGGNTSSGSNITANNSSVPVASSNANSVVTNRSWNAYKVLDENGNDADYPDVYYPAFYFEENGDLHALFYAEGSGESQRGGSWQFIEKFYSGLYNYMFTDDDGFSYYVNYSMEDDEFTCDFGDYIIYYKDYN